jgi:hypothetical protein
MTPSSPDPAQRMLASVQAESEKAQQLFPYSVIVPRTTSMTHVPGSRRQEEQQLIEELLALYPMELRADIQRDLTDRQSRSRYAMVDTPEKARLFGLIYSIRDADHQAEVRERSRSAAATTPTRVSIVLVESVPETGAVAVVQRRPEAVPQNVILLTRQGLRADVLNHALGAVVTSRSKFGDVLLGEFRLPIRGSEHFGPVSQRRRGWLEAKLRRLPETPRVPIEDVGTVHAMRLTIPPGR